MGLSACFRPFVHVAGQIECSSCNFHTVNVVNYLKKFIQYSNIGHQLDFPAESRERIVTMLT